MRLDLSLDVNQADEKLESSPLEKQLCYQGTTMSKGFVIVQIYFGN